MIEVGIVGSSGYVAGELLRCLLRHPEVNINCLYSHSNAGKKAAELHQDLFTHPNLKFTDTLNLNVDVVFLCLGHGNSSTFLEKHSFSEQTKIIDLSNDFRLKNNSTIKQLDFTYGLVELNKAAIQSSKAVANPGCFATAIQLALLPLAKNNLLESDIHVNAITGSTGAGKTPADTSHFSWRNNNISIYKAFRHQHLDEINESILSLQNGFNSKVNMVPVRGNFTRGIFVSLYTASNLSEEEAVKCFKDFYKDAPFTVITKNTINLKQVVNTNYCLIQVQKIDDQLFITSAIDNLLKGAAGQAIQNMNLMFGLEESTGLDFKPNYF